IRKPNAVGSWLYGAAYRLAVRAKADAARRQLRERRAEKGQRTDPPAEDWREVRPLLDEELSLLPEKYRAPLVLCYLESKTQREAARLLGYAEGSMSWRLERGRALLRERLARRGVTLSAGALAAVLAGEAAAAA